MGRVVQFGGEPDLGEEALPAQHGGQLGAKYLESHLAVVFEVPRQVDRGYAPVPELQGVPLGERGGEDGVQWHGPEPTGRSGGAQGT